MDIVSMRGEFRMEMSTEETGGAEEQDFQAKVMSSSWRSTSAGWISSRQM
jgi:hypothetical protein